MKGRKIRVFDYVNHPYEEVQEALVGDATAVFRDATRSAATRASSVASHLHVNVAGIEIGTDIAISVTNVEQRSAEVTSPPVTMLSLEWKASGKPHLFPFMRAELSIYPLTATETQLDFSGIYQPPLGALGGAIDAIAGRRIAEASVHRFVNDVAAHLKATLTNG